ncbi:MAG: TraB/GumN family protein [Pseudomonadota bacterium]
MKTELLALFLATTLFASSGCAKEPEKHMLFQIPGESNSVYLLGSIHMLRKQDHPLPEVMQDAYEDAEVLVMELDMDDIDMAALAGLFGSAAAATDGETLESLMGDSYPKAVEMADAIDANLTVFNKFEPWFVATTIVQLEMMKIGFYEHLGVESYFTKLAEEDQKEILGLETAEFQLSLFDEMPLEEQRQLFVLSLEQAGDIEVEMGTMVDAWDSGNVEALHDMLNDSMSSMESFYQELVVNRNKNWIPEIEGFLKQNDDYLVIVGAGHLTGEYGVVELLRQRGFEVQQH